MLGRNAANLFWMSRFMERAENMARLLDVGHRMALTAGTMGTGDHLRSMLQAAAVDRMFDAKHDETALAPVAHFILFDKENPSSIYNCLAGARTNARSVRTAMTQDMWSSLNDTWLEYAGTRPNTITPNRLPAFLAWIKSRSQQFRGALLSTHLRNDGYCFAQLGNFIERGDNTARILDVKYYVLLPSVSHVGSTLDNVQWETILRSVSALRAYRWLHGGDVNPTGIADFLVLDGQMPRSLVFCYRKIVDNLGFLAQNYQQRHSCHDQAEALLVQLQNHSIQSILEFGLHEFIGEFLRDNAALGSQIELAYRFNE